MSESALPSGAQRALPAVIFGIVGEVGEIGGQRLACPRAFERVHSKDLREARLWRDLLGQVSRELAEDEVVMVDAGVKIRDLQQAGVKRYVVRLATHFTARRNVPAPYSGQGRRPIYGQKVRPLPGQRKGKLIPAILPDRVETGEVEGRSLRAEIWEDLLLPGVKPGPKAQSFHVYALYDLPMTSPGCWQPLCRSKLRRSAPCIKTAGPLSKFRSPLNIGSVLIVSLSIRLKVFSASPNWRSWQARFSVTWRLPSRCSPRVSGTVSPNAPQAVFGGP